MEFYNAVISLNEDIDYLSDVSQTSLLKKVKSYINDYDGLDDWKDISNIYIYKMNMDVSAENMIMLIERYISTKIEKEHIFSGKVDEFMEYLIENNLGIAEIDLFAIWAIDQGGVDKLKKVMKGVSREKISFEHGGLDYPLYFASQEKDDYESCEYLLAYVYPDFKFSRSDVEHIEDVMYDEHIAKLKKMLLKKDFVKNLESAENSQDIGL